MKKTVKIFMLPTEAVEVKMGERMQKFMDETYAMLNDEDRKKHDNMTACGPSQIVATSTDDIVEGDWYVATGPKSYIRQCKKGCELNGFIDKDGNKAYHKVVATTNSDHKLPFVTGSFPLDYMTSDVKVTEAEIEFNSDGSIKVNEVNGQVYMTWEK